jgi:para-nitrobenzyl esterase
LSAGSLAGLAFHCLDVPFVFDTLSEQGMREVAGQAPPASLAADMHGAWVRFVTDGDPGWERYETSSRPLMAFAEPSEIREDPLRWERTAWASRSRSSLS